MNYGKHETSQKKKELNSKQSKIEKKGMVTIIKALCIGAIALSVLCICIGIGLVRGIIANAPEVSWESIAPSGAASYLYDIDGNEMVKLAASGANRRYVSLDEIPENLQHAFVAIEDERFYEHNGIDLRGIVRAFFSNLKSGSLSEGASTITQQLLKNSVFTEWTTEASYLEKFERKIQEQYLAIEIEKHLSKEIILENYLNAINLGAGAYGVEAAAQVYFGKSASELDLSECAVIAAITQNPTAYNPIAYPNSNNERRLTVLENMYKQGYITESEYNNAVNDDVYARITGTESDYTDLQIYSYFEDAVITSVKEALMTQKGYTSSQADQAIYRGGLQIYTTQDSNIQQIADEEFSNPDNYPEEVEYYMEYALSVTKADGSVVHYSKEMLQTYFREKDSSFTLLFSEPEEGAKYIEEYEASVLETGDEVLLRSLSYTPQPQSSVVIMDQTTGYVMALIGGRGEKESSLSLNRATQSTRQPGSTFKIISTFAAALDAKGMTLATTYDNAPYHYPDGREVNNWDNQYTGLTNIRESIEHSINITTVKAFMDVTIDTSTEYIKDFGITTLSESDTGGSVSLGGLTDGVTNVELTASYAAIANGGTYNEPIYFTKVLDQSGNVIIDNTADQESRNVIKETTAFLLTNAMQDVVTGANGTASAVKLSNMPVAGKTGTTTDYKDIWFSGYTPYYTCSIWTGYDNNKILASDDIYRSYAQVLWKSIMQRVHEELPSKTFETPSNITTAYICSKSGLLAVDGLCDHDSRGDMTYLEYFELGTEPTTYCTLHQEVEVCTVSGHRSTEYCPSTVKKVFFNMPSGNDDSTSDADNLPPTKFCSVHKEPETEEETEEETKEEQTDEPQTESTQTEAPQTDPQTDAPTPVEPDSPENPDGGDDDNP